MSDKGSIGTLGYICKGSQDQGPRASMHSINLGHVTMALGAKDTSDGNSQPSLRIDARGRYKFRWVVASGTRTISIDVKQAVNVTPRPTLVVLANPDVGLSGDTTGTAGSGTGFVTIGPVSISPNAAGAVWVELRANYDCGPLGAPCYWDNIVVT